jgi:hypothetical protein
MYRKQRSKRFGLAESTKILTEFFYAIVDRNLAVCQKGLKRKLGHFREAARLRER